MPSASRADDLILKIRRADASPAEIEELLGAMAGLPPQTRIEALGALGRTFSSPEFEIWTLPQLKSAAEVHKADPDIGVRQTAESLSQRLAYWEGAESPAALAARAAHDRREWIKLAKSFGDSYSLMHFGGIGVFLFSWWVHRRGRARR